ncbi:MAG TPA: DUF4167 domain-containing protein [Stellaceae bacterium]|nr:DUF4167 domain-containing protein [Stellaceae bacterium]
MHRDFKGIMRPGQNKRGRNRGGGGNMNGGGGGGGGHPGNRPRPPHRIQTFESSGPNVKIRGNAYQVFERYIAMAREASSAGDRIAAENFYQHAEHYFRVMNADGNGHGYPQQQRPMTPADTEMNGDLDIDQPEFQAGRPPVQPEAEPDREPESDQPPQSPTTN